MRKPIITVVGSINMDLVVTAMKRPEAGETILGEDFYSNPGGKGANQAVAASRLGAEVHMIGRVGDDEFGADLMNFLKQENIFLHGVEPVTQKASGVAMITLADGDNSIIVYQGANLETTPEYIRKFESLIAKSDVVLTQLEIPIESVEETARLCQKHHTQFILNPAPAADLSSDLIMKTDFITPNQLERSALFEKIDMNQFLEKLIVTEGKDGVVYYEQQTQHRVPSYSVAAVDTTGAGDTFNGAFAYAIGMKEDVKTACHFANAAAALSVQKIGAQAGMPTKEEVNEFIRNHG